MVFNHHILPKCAKSRERGAEMKVLTIYHVARGANYEKETLSILSSAQATEKAVKFNIDGCQDGHPKMSWVDTY